MPIELPGWEDVIVLQDPRTLPPAEHLRRRRDLARRLRESPTPEVARNVGSFLTYLDDIEDLISSAIFLGVGVFGLLSRAHPLVRGAMTAAKVLDSARVLSPLGLIGRPPKRYSERHRLNDPYDAIHYVDHDAGIAELSRRIGPLLELGQAMETLFGVGLVLGPIVGALNDLLFTTPLGIPLEYAYGVIEPLTSSALGVIRASPLGWLEGQTFTKQEHLTMALGTLLAWQIARPWITASPVARTLLALAERAVHPRRVTNSTSISVLADLRLPTTPAPQWPLPGEPATIRPIDASHHLLARARQTQREIYDAWGDTPEGNLFFAAERQILKIAIPAVSGGRPVWREGLSPRARLFAALLESPPEGIGARTPDTLATLVERGHAVQQATGRAIPPRPDLQDLLRPQR